MHGTEDRAEAVLETETRATPWAERPLVRAVLVQDAVAARAALRAVGGFVADPDTLPPGYYVPRAAALSLGAVERRARSWEAFDRAMRRARDAVVADLVPFVVASGLRDAAFARELAWLSGGVVVRADPAMWARAAASPPTVASELPGFTERAWDLLGLTPR